MTRWPDGQMSPIHCRYATGDLRPVRDPRRANPFELRQHRGGWLPALERDRHHRRAVPLLRTFKWRNAWAVLRDDVLNRDRDFLGREIGRASCRERVSISVVAGSIK